jgi:4'-phosphopantetheinyl transferase
MHVDEDSTLFFVLQPDEVHVWVADLDASAAEIDAYRRLLAADECERAGRLRFEQLRVRFVAGRGILRRLLGRYLQVAPGEVGFVYGPHGKPALAAPLGLASHGMRPSLAFNLAHSHNIAVYALAQAGRIGVDVEQMREVIEREQIVERFFSAHERQALAELPPVQREEAFFLCWTRKEAYLKALGAGMSFPLDRFSVSLKPGEPPTLLQAAEGYAGDDPVGEPAGKAWTLFHFEPAPRCYGAVAVEGCNWQLRLRQWRP